MVAFLPSNLRSLGDKYRAALQGRSFKLTLLHRLLTQVRLEHPAAFAFGFGPGQFASRAALIGTGLYFGGLQSPRGLPVLDAVRPPATEAYVMDLWVEVSKIRSAGSSLRPFSSWLAVMSEAGVAGCLLVAAVTLVLLWRAGGRARHSGQRLLGLSFGAMLIFLFLLGAQEHYWETPQAILPGCMLLKLVYANLAPSGVRHPARGSTAPSAPTT